MTTPTPPPCYTCKHRHAIKGSIKCNAFPGGVPEEITSSQHSHRKPYPNDGGIQWEAEIE